MKKLYSLVLSIFLINSVASSQTIVQGEANLEPSNLAFNFGAKQWYLNSSTSTVNSFFIGVGRMPSIKNPLFFDVNLHFVPKFNFEYYSKGSNRTFKGDTKATKVGNINVGILLAKKYSKSIFHPIVGIGGYIIFKPGYNSISPSYYDYDDRIDNNGLGIGVAPYLGGMLKFSKQIHLIGKVGWNIAANKNQYEKTYNLYEEHLFSEIGLKLHFNK